mmetsp:Transcript_18684/g.45007  ORF Transcript_18684/g.45007 Transcript_18684/m.45007 type:complete len:283 (+) Transcript_18684:264-1112(+)
MWASTSTTLPVCDAPPSLRSWTQYTCPTSFSQSWLNPELAGVLLCTVSKAALDRRNASTAPTSSAAAAELSRDKTSKHFPQLSAQSDGSQPRDGSRRHSSTKYGDGGAAPTAAATGPRWAKVDGFEEQRPLRPDISRKTGASRATAPRSTSRTLDNGNVRISPRAALSIRENQACTVSTSPAERLSELAKCPSASNRRLQPSLSTTTSTSRKVGGRPPLRSGHVYATAAQHLVPEQGRVGTMATPPPHDVRPPRPHSQQSQGTVQSSSIVLEAPQRNCPSEP